MLTPPKWFSSVSSNRRPVNHDDNNKQTMQQPLYQAFYYVLHPCAWQLGNDRIDEERLNNYSYFSYKPRILIYECIMFALICLWVWRYLFSSLNLLNHVTARNCTGTSQRLSPSPHTVLRFVRPLSLRIFISAHCCKVAP